MRLWIEVETYALLLTIYGVSLVWGCELKYFHWFLGRHIVMVSLVWGCELKYKFRTINISRRLVSLVWGCELKSPYTPPIYEAYRSASYEAVNWSILILLLLLLLSRSASYEAVNWSIKRTISIIFTNRSASYEAVNWSKPSSSVKVQLRGQPRMRLWIEV